MARLQRHGRNGPSRGSGRLGAGVMVEWRGHGSPSTSRQAGRGQRASRGGRGRDVSAVTGCGRCRRARWRGRSGRRRRRGHTRQAQRRRRRSRPPCQSVGAVVRCGGVRRAGGVVLRGRRKGGGGGGRVAPRRRGRGRLRDRVLRIASPHARGAAGRVGGPALAPGGSRSAFVVGGVHGVVRPGRRGRCRLSLAAAGVP